MAHKQRAQGTPQAVSAGGASGHNRLGAFLCWAVVFADIGTSVYYVPGILYGQVGRLAGLFVFLTLVVFLLLTLKYAEVSARFPEGGGVVTVASRAFNPWIGALGGMFILVDYFLTAAISSLSGVLYLQAIIPPLRAGNIPPEWLPLVPPLLFTILLMVGAIFVLTRLDSRTGNLKVVVAIAIGTVLAAVLFLALALSMQRSATTLLVLGIATLLGGLSLGILGGILGGLSLSRSPTPDERLSKRGVAIVAAFIFGAVAVFAVLILFSIQEFVLHLGIASLFALSVLAGLGGLLGTGLGWFRSRRLNNLDKLLSVVALGGALGLSIVFGWAFVELITGATLLTLGIVSFLGWLNYRGIKESASASAIAAVAALLSDLLILVVIVLRVPLPTIQLVFRDMFTSQRLAPLTLLTGYAGAFLAFSGLESISQLSPVMRIPRKKTVTQALALVFITVGVTSPLLTLFSTVLLTDPQFKSTMLSPAYASHPSPDAFISQLAGAYAGPVLAIATAITAATLLVFACNTAIIGAYHVFLALTRMQFFPDVLELPSSTRGTPKVAIAVSTVIPIVTLFLVNGRIDTLGNLYAFGLLGAFSLTCISLDVIRFRERHGAPHVGAEIDPELMGQQPSLAQPQEASNRVWQALSSRVGHWINPAVRRRADGVLRWISALLAELSSDASYYLGFLTTLLVGIAWVTNLIYKPDATIFGGGLTVLGLGIAVLHYRYQQRRGEPVVFLDTPAFMPDSWLVILTPLNGHNKQVIQAAVEATSGHPLAFLFLAPQSPHEAPPRLFEIKNRFGADYHARKALSRAKRDAMARQINAKYFYAVGGAKQVFDIARRIRPDEIVADEQVAKRITRAAPSEAGMAVSPEYVRYQHVDGVTVAHNVLHELYTHPTNVASNVAASPSAPARGPAESSSRRGSPVSQQPAEQLPPASAGNTGTSERAAGDQKPVGGDKASSNGGDPTPGRSTPPRGRTEQ